MRSSSRLSRGSRLLMLSLAATVAALLGGGAYATLTLQDRAARITALGADLEAHQQRLATLEAQLSERDTRLKLLEQDNLALTKKLDSTYAAVDVGGRVDFPVLRGMARAGDTLASFAKREGTTPDVVIALNPWVRTHKGPLADRASLWIPKR